MSGDKSRIRTAHHEAGHAVACCLLGGRVLTATIVSDGLAAGRVRWMGDIGFVETQIVTLAGPIAELRCVFGFYADFDIRDAQGWVTDHARIREAYIDRQGYAPTWLDEDPAYRQALRVAHRSVSDYWPTIQQVAALLLEHGTISGQQVAQTIGRITRARCPQGEIRESVSTF